MNTIYFVACIGMIAGFFLCIGLKPLEFSDGLYHLLMDRKSSLRSEIKASAREEKGSFLRREILQAQEILAMTGKEHQISVLCAASLLCFGIGVSAAILLENLFLVPVLAVGMMMIPFWYVKMMEHHFKKDISAELETALSIITTAYLRNEDILTAVEENLHYLNPPVYQVFQSFLIQIKLVDPDVERGLKVLKPKIDNEVFQEWVDAIGACQHDRSLKSTLTPIVSKLSDMRVVNGELENLIFEPRKEFITMVILVVGNIPLMYLLNQSWYNTLMHTMLGKFILAVCGAIIFVSTAFVIRLTRPIEYRR